MNAPEPINGFSIYQIIGFIVIFIILAAVVSYSKNIMTIDFSSWFKSNNLDSINERTGETIAYQPAPVEQKDVPMGLGKTAALSEMYWCLIGEDMAGRWCVQVQDEKNCDKDRTFKSKNECEKLYPKK
jgi:hypothetical protein